MVVFLVLKSCRSLVVMNGLMKMLSWKFLLSSDSDCVWKGMGMCVVMKVCWVRLKVVVYRLSMNMEVVNIVRFGVNSMLIVDRMVIMLVIIIVNCLLIFLIVYLVGRFLYSWLIIRVEVMRVVKVIFVFIEIVSIGISGIIVFLLSENRIVGRYIMGLNWWRIVDVLFMFLCYFLFGVFFVDMFLCEWMVC